MYELPELVSSQSLGVGVGEGKQAEAGAGALKEILGGHPCTKLKTGMGGLVNYFFLEDFSVSLLTRLLLVLI